MALLESNDALGDAVIKVALGLHKQIDGTPYVFDAKTGDLLWQLPKDAANDLHRFQFSQDSQLLVGISGQSSKRDIRQIMLLDAETGHVLHSRPLPTYSLYGNPDFHFALSSDRQHFAVAISSYQDKTPGDILIWELSNPDLPLRTLRGHQGLIETLAFFPDGNRICSSSDAERFRETGIGETKIWNVSTGEELMSFPERMHSLSFSQDGTTLVGNRQTDAIRIRQWSAKSLQPSVEAQLYVETLLSRKDQDTPTLTSELITRVESDDSLTKEVRDIAVTILKQTSSSPMELAREGWNLPLKKNPSIKSQQRALANLLEACQAPPDSIFPIVWRARALAHFRLQQPSEAAMALSEYQKILEAKNIPLMAEDLVVQALVHQQQGEIEAARGLMDEIRRTRSGNEEQYKTLLAELETLLSIPIASESPQDWIGKSLMPREAAWSTTANVPKLFPQLPFTVLKVDGDRLWTGTLWIERRDTVPFEDAISYYESQFPGSFVPPRMDTLIDCGRYELALGIFDSVLRKNEKDAGALNSRAWLLATCPDEKIRDGKRAVIDATLCCELANWKDANQLDTLAAAYAESGEFEQAVKWQKEAISLLKIESRRADCELRLQLYREGKPYHAPLP